MDDKEYEDQFDEDEPSGKEVSEYGGEGEDNESDMSYAKDGADDEMIITVPTAGAHSSESKRREDRITSSFLTKYERARILGTRALQLSKNAPPMVIP